MSLKGIEKHLHLRDARGEEIPTAFAPVPDACGIPAAAGSPFSFIPAGSRAASRSAGNRLGRTFDVEDGQEAEVRAAEIPFRP